MSTKSKRPATPPEKADTIGPTTSTEPDENDGLSVLELKFVDLSASGATMEEMALALGTCARTLRRWKQRPQVATAIRNRACESMALARATLASSANRAARALDELATDATPDHARIAACKAIIENATKLGELQEINDRLSELEAQLTKKGH
jgi:hypothetical protein